MTDREPTWSDNTRKILQDAVAAPESSPGTADVERFVTAAAPARDTLLTIHGRSGHEEPASVVCSSCGATLLRGEVTVPAALLQHLQPCAQAESEVSGYSVGLPPTAVLLDECDRVDEAAGRHGGFVTTARIRQLLGGGR